MPPFKILNLRQNGRWFEFSQPRATMIRAAHGQRSQHFRFGNPLDQDHLIFRTCSGDDRDVASWDVEPPGKEPDELLVGLAIDWWGSERDSNHTLRLATGSPFAMHAAGR
jgi:hypothetical protein